LLIRANEGNDHRMIGELKPWKPRTSLVSEMLLAYARTPGPLEIIARPAMLERERQRQLEARAKVIDVKPEPTPEAVPTKIGT
jgi:hypothetical protein